MSESETTDDRDPGADARQYFESYTHYARLLRGWLVAYGVGVPALLIGRPETLKALGSAASRTVLLFLGGVAFQVLAAAIYKLSMWHLYHEASGWSSKASRWYKLSNFVSDSPWVDPVIDFGTLTLYACATYTLVLRVSA